MIDSGASASFIRKGTHPSIRVDPLSDAEAKRRWRNASNGEIKQFGTSTVDFFTKQGAGKRMQMTDPMVEPTMPRTSSMSGMLMATRQVVTVTQRVMPKNLLGGM